MCFLITQNVAKHIFSRSYYTICTVEKTAQFFVIFKKLPNENNRPMGEKSPILVTLGDSKKFCYPATWGSCGYKFFCL
jgi:hypothetical protein